MFDGIRRDETHLEQCGFAVEVDGGLKDGSFLMLTRLDCYSLPDKIIGEFENQQFRWLVVSQDGAHALLTCDKYFQ